MDLFLPAGSAALFAHGRIVNPSAEKKLAYWWTNIAAPMSDGTRVLSPAEYSVEHIWPGNNLGHCDFPRQDWDASYPANWTNATSVFFRAPSAPRRFVMSVDRSGYGLAQTSTDEMAGRKFFYFGSASGGQNWMDYLSRPGEGKYLEIQSGITPTQNQRFALEGSEELEWTEVFFPVSLDAAKAHDPDYRAAALHGASAVNAAVPADELARVDAFLREQARLPLNERFSEGQAWGMRQERLLGRPLASCLNFTVASPGDAWDDLSSGAAISQQSLERLPDGVAISKLWIERLRASAAVQGWTWFHELMLAVALCDEGDAEAARLHVDRSLAAKATWLGFRLRALLDPDTDAATADYLQAWQMGDAPAELAVEIATYFMKTERSENLKAFVDTLPAAVRDNERIILARAVVAANDGSFDELERLLFSRQFATIREGETLLSDLWIRLRKGRLEAGLRRAATAAELKQDLAAHPMPAGLDLRMHQIEEA